MDRILLKKEAVSKFLHRPLEKPTAKTLRSLAKNQIRDLN